STEYDGRDNDVADVSLHFPEAAPLPQHPRPHPPPPTGRPRIGPALPPAPRPPPPAHRAAAPAAPPYALEPDLPQRTTRHAALGRQPPARLAAPRQGLRVRRAGLARVGQGPGHTAAPRATGACPGTRRGDVR